MRWITFVILLYAVTVLQTTVAPFLAVHSIRPDFLVILATHYALAARPQDGLLACWFVGLAADLTGAGYAHHSGIGVHSLAMGLAALCVMAVRELTFRDSVIAQLFVTFFVSFLQGIFVGAYGCWVSANPPRLGDVILAGFYSAVYTALLAPYGHWALRRMRGVLGLGAAGRVRVG